PLPRGCLPHLAGKVGAGGGGGRSLRKARRSRHLGDDRRDDAPAAGAAEGRKLRTLEPASEPLIKRSFVVKPIKLSGQCAKAVRAAARVRFLAARRKFGYVCRYTGGQFRHGKQSSIG